MSRSHEHRCDVVRALAQNLPEASPLDRSKVGVEGTIPADSMRLSAELAVVLCALQAANLLLHLTRGLGHVVLSPLLA